MPTSFRRAAIRSPDPAADLLEGAQHPKRVVFAEGEEEQVIRAAVSFVNQGSAPPILIGREDEIRETAKQAGIDIDRPGIEIVNARLSDRNSDYADYPLWPAAARGYLQRDCQRLINNDRNHFGAIMVARGDADAMVTGLTRNYSTALDDVRRCIDVKPGHRVIGVSLALCRGRTVLVADTAVIDMPIRRNWPTSPRRPPAWPAGSATSRASRCWPIPPSATRRRTLGKGASRRSRSSTGAGSISSMTARWPPMSRSTWTR
jgi:hypothetical protein